MHQRRLSLPFDDEGDRQRRNREREKQREEREGKVKEIANLTTFSRGIKRLNSGGEKSFLSSSESTFVPLSLSSDFLPCDFTREVASCNPWWSLFFLSTTLSVTLFSQSVSSSHEISVIIPTFTSCRRRGGRNHKMIDQEKTETGIQGIPLGMSYSLFCWLLLNNTHCSIFLTNFGAHIFCRGKLFTVSQSPLPSWHSRNKFFCQFLFSSHTTVLVYLSDSCEPEKSRGA